MTGLQCRGRDVSDRTDTQLNQLHRTPAKNNPRLCLFRDCSSGQLELEVRNYGRSCGWPVRSRRAQQRPSECKLSSIYDGKLKARRFVHESTHPIRVWTVVRPTDGGRDCGSPTHDGTAVAFWRSSRYRSPRSSAMEPPVSILVGIRNPSLPASEDLDESSAAAPRGAS
jgi:hypothetical protein